MLLLGLDFETTGLDFAKDRITEVGAVLWDTAMGMPVRMLNLLIQHADAPPITEEITRLTGITQAMLDQHGTPANSAFTTLRTMMSLAEVVVAHNGTGFDRPMLEEQLARLELPPVDLMWIDTCMDVPFPEHITTRKLVHLAAEHGFLNPFAHRAVFDVLTMLKVVAAYPLEPILASAKQPIVTCIARVSFDDREKAKERGYRWKPNSKLWVRHLKQHQAEKELAEAGFLVEVVAYAPRLD